MAKYKGDLHNPDLVICLDSFAYSDKTMTITSSLRGYYDFDLSATVGKQAVHSGVAGGVMPMAFPILNNLLQRV